MRACLQLVPRDLQHPIVVFCQQQLFKSAGALRVQALPNQEGYRFLLNRHRLHWRRQQRFWFALRKRRHFGWYFFCQLADVLWAGTTAAPHYPHAVFPHILRQHLREWFGLLRINRLSVHVHWQTSVWDAGNGQGGMFT